MTEKEILEEYKSLLEEYNKIDNEKTKTFCLQSLGIGLGCIALEVITKSEIFSPIFLGGVAYFGTKNIFDEELFFYPIINHSLYKEILNEYQTCNQRIAEFINKSKENDPAFIAGIYQSLLNRGHFSYKRQIYNISSESPYFILPPENFGLNIINGHCVNKYIAIHFKDILNELGFTNATLPVFLNNNIYNHLKENNWNFMSDTTNESLLDKQSKIDNFFDYQIAKILGNYWLNVCKASNTNEVYYIDIMNETFYQKRNKNNLELSNAHILKKLGISKKEYTLPIKFLNDKFHKTESNKKLAKELLSYNSISNTEASAVYSYGQKYVERNIQDFEKLYETNQSSFIEISNKLSELKNVIQNYEKEKRNKLKTKTKTRK